MFSTARAAGVLCGPVSPFAARRDVGFGEICLVRLGRAARRAALVLQALSVSSQVMCYGKRDLLKPAEPGGVCRGGFPAGWEEPWCPAGLPVGAALSPTGLLLLLHQPRCPVDGERGWTPLPQAGSASTEIKPTGFAPASRFGGAVMLPSPGQCSPLCLKASDPGERRTEGHVWAAVASQPLGSLHGPGSSLSLPGCAVVPGCSGGAALAMCKAVRAGSRSASADKSGPEDICVATLSPSCTRAR